MDQNADLSWPIHNQIYKQGGSLAIADLKNFIEHDFEQVWILVPESVKGH